MRIKQSPPTTCNITQHHTTSHNITQHHTTSHNITQHHTTSHNIIQHHKTTTHKQDKIGDNVGYLYKALSRARHWHTNASFRWRMEWFISATQWNDPCGLNNVWPFFIPSREQPSERAINFHSFLRQMESYDHPDHCYWNLSADVTPSLPPVDRMVEVVEMVDQVVEVVDQMVGENVGEKFFPEFEANSWARKSSVMKQFNKCQILWWNDVTSMFLLQSLDPTLTSSSTLLLKRTEYFLINVLICGVSFI